MFLKIAPEVALPVGYTHPCYLDKINFSLKHIILNVTQICARDARGVVITLIADNYFGYCKKEVRGGAASCAFTS